MTLILALLALLTGYVLGYSVSELRRAHRIVDAILSGRLCTHEPGMGVGNTVTIATLDARTGHPIGEPTYPLGGRVPQEPT